MKTFEEVRAKASAAVRAKMKNIHRQMHDFVGHHIENTGQTHDEIKTKFLKKFGTHHAKKFDHIVRKMVD